MQILRPAHCTLSELCSCTATRSVLLISSPALFRLVERPQLFFFFIQAEDGIRDHCVTEFRRVLFRSVLGARIVGRVNLYLLDSNISDNPRPEDRQITDQLYGGDSDKRIRQEIVLGIGGVRALKAVGVQPTVYHMNEGHSAFLALERIRLLMQEQKLTFEEALEACRINNVFTTHTPVPAGIDLFHAGMMYFYF